MDKLGHKIRVARVDAMLSQSDLAKLVGVSRSAIASYELGVNEPPISILQAISRSTGKPISWFLSDDDHLVAQVAEHISRYGVSSPKKIPVLGKVPAGDWDDASLPDAIDYLDLSNLSASADFALIVQGNSMHPTIHDGAYVLVQFGRLPKNRDIVVVRNEHGDATLKRYIKLKDKVYLVADNPEYDDVRSEIGFVVGVVVAVIQYLVPLPSTSVTP